MTTIDPVCGMEVESSSPQSFAFEGTTYHFCSDRCRQRFLQQPEEFLPAEKAEPPKRGVGSEKVRQPGRGAKWTDYLPLFVLVAVTVLAAAALEAAYPGPWIGLRWMRNFMGFFLVLFSMFKFFNLEGFADGFQMYDLLAKPVRAYAYLYPFLELGLGLGYLAAWRPALVATATVILLVFGSLGVFRALAKGLDLDCACLGTVLSVPLSTVALVEDLGMAAMAAAMLLAPR